MSHATPTPAADPVAILRAAREALEKTFHQRSLISLETMAMCRAAFAATAAIQPAGEPMHLNACFRSTLDYGARTVTLQFKESDQAVEFHKSIFSDAPVRIAIAQQDDKAGQAGDDDRWHSLTCDGSCSPPCKDATPAAPEGKAEASEIATWQDRATELGFSGRPQGYPDTDEQEELKAAEIADLRAALAARPPVASVGSIGDDLTFCDLITDLTGAVEELSHLRKAAWYALVAYIDARPPVATPDAEAIRSAALEEAANAICTLARRYTTDYSTAVTDAVHAIRALSQPSPAVKSAEPTEHPAITVLREVKREDVAGYKERGFVISTGLRAKIQALLEEAGEDPFKSAEPTGDEPIISRAEFNERWDAAMSAEPTGGPA
jgi:hypothetical protein